MKVTLDNVDSNSEMITIAAAASPSFFLKDFTDGVAWVTGAGCETTECAVPAGPVYQLWGNGFGPKNAAQQDGAPAAYKGLLTPLEVSGEPRAAV